MIKIFKRKVNIDRVFALNYEEQKDFVDSFPIPKDEIDRSFFQYRCQQYGRSKCNLYLLNTLSVFVLLGIVPILVFKKFLSGFTVNRQVEAIFPYKGMYDRIIPSKYTSKYNILEVPYQKGIRYSSLSLKNLKFLFSIYKRRPLNFYFLATILYKLSFYSYLISRYRPKVIFCSAEYSFSSSVLTLYCEQEEITHINVMHGEKIFSFTDSFFVFHKCTIWDVHYKDLFVSLRAHPDQFEICIPPGLILNLNRETNPLFDYTYYLGGEKEEQLNKIADLLKSLARKGAKVNVRFHPRYSDKRAISEIFGSVSIENPKIVPIKESFEQTNCVVALYSTVLYQGLLNGKDVMIDDVTCDKMFLEKLKELKYYVFTSNVKFASKDLVDMDLP